MIKKILIISLLGIVSFFAYKKYKESKKSQRSFYINKLDDYNYEELRKSHDENSKKIIVHHLSPKALDSAAIVFWIFDSNSHQQHLSNKKDTNHVYYDKNNYAFVPLSFSPYYEGVLTKQELIDFYSSVDSNERTSMQNRNIWRAKNMKDEYKRFVFKYKMMYDDGKSSGEIIHEPDDANTYMMIDRTSPDSRKYQYGIVISKYKIDSLKRHKLRIKRDVIADEYQKSLKAH